MFYIEWQHYQKFDRIINIKKQPTSDIRLASWQHDDVIKWKHFSRYWSLVRGIHRLPVKSPTKASDLELRRFLLSAPWINGWIDNREAGDLRRHRTHYDVIVMRMTSEGERKRHLSCFVYRQTVHGNYSATEKLMTNMTKKQRGVWLAKC